jgi:hypothetical protein
MPRLVADQNRWHSSATRLCVGQGEQPSRFEWELRSGAASVAIDSDEALHYQSLYPRPTDEGNRTGSLCLPCFLRSKIKRRKAVAAAARRFHSLGTNQRFWSIRPRLKSTKNWSPDSPRGSRLSFEWIASGFTVVCFWTAPAVPPRAGIRALEGPVRFRLAWAPHWPD